MFAFCLVAGGIALLFGLLFDLVFLTPLRVPLHQSPISKSNFIEIFYRLILIALLFVLNTELEFTDFNFI